MKHCLCYFLSIWMATAILLSIPIRPSAEDTQPSTAAAEESIPYSAAVDGLVNTESVTQEEINVILQNAASYSALDDNSRSKINRFYKLQATAMSACEEAGYSIADSIPLAQMMQGLELPLADIECMIDSFGSLSQAKEQADEFISYIYDYYIFALADLSAEKQLLTSGCPAADILTAFCIAQALELNTADVIASTNPAADYAQANGITEEEALERIAQFQQEHGIGSVVYASGETMFDPLQFPAAPFAYTESDMGRVNVSSGGLDFSRTEAVVPGRNGFDLNLTTHYTSDEGKVSYLFSSNSGNRDVLKSTISPLINFAAGWSFRFSHIERQSSFFYYDAIILADGTYLLYRDERDANGQKTGNFEIDHRYALKDFTFEPSTEFTNGTVSSYYRIAYKDGRKEYFDGSGRLIGMVDRFSNTIRFTYADNDHVTITDSCGQTTTIARTADQLILTTPDEQQVIYQLATVGVMYNSKVCNVVTVTSVTDQIGRVTQYSNKANLSWFDFTGSTWNQAPYATCYIDQITYPSGAKTIITYEYSYVNCGGYSSIQRARIKEKTVSTDDGISKTESYRYAGKMVDAFDNHYTYQTDANGLSHTFEFDGSDGALLGETIKNGDILLKGFGYNYQYRLISSVNEVDYDPADSSKYIARRRRREYNEAGDLLKEWSYLADGNTADTEHLTQYTYSPTYHDLIEKRYKQDSATEIIESYTPSADQKTIATAAVTENGLLRRKTDFTYDSYGNVLSQKDYTNATDFITTTYTYQNGAFMASKQVAGLPAETFDYDTMGHLLTHTDAEGNATNYTYDNLGRQEAKTHPDGSSTTTFYEDAQNSIVVMNENGYSLKYQYNQAGQPLYVLDRRSNTKLQEIAYDNNMRATTVWDGNRNKQVTAYDVLDRPLTNTIYDTAGTQQYRESYQYEDAYSSSLSRIIKTVDGDTSTPTLKTAVYYDKRKDAVKQSRFNGAIELIDTVRMDYVGNPIETLSARDSARGLGFTQKTRYTYDGKVKSVTNAANQTASNAYDLLSHLISATDANGNTSRYVYDAAGRLTEEYLPLTSDVDTFKQYAYNNNGLKTEEYITNGPLNSNSKSRTSYRYNNRSRLEQIIQYNEEEPVSYIHYFYDGVGNLEAMHTGLTEPLSQTNRGNVTYYMYDHLNRLVRQTDPLGEYVGYDYDNNGNVWFSSDRNGAQIRYTYNYRNQPTSIVAALPDEDTITQTYTYGKTGARTGMQNGNSSTAYTYNALGQLITETTDNVRKVYSYDAADSRTSFELYNYGMIQMQQTYAYDNAGRLETVRNGQTILASYAYDANGNLTQKTSGSLTSAYTYNKANLVTSLENKAGDEVLSAYQYAYYCNGLQSSKTDSLHGTTTYAYDDRGQLIQETAPDYTLNFTYDASGNRTSQTRISGGNTTATTYTYDANNRLTHETASAGDIETHSAYYYDPNGNLITKMGYRLTPETSSDTIEATVGQSSEYAQIFSYDALNRLTQAQIGDTTATYTYDADGLRQSKTVNGVTTRQIWDGSNIIAETDSTGELAALYYRGAGLILRAAEGSRQYYMTDGHGDVVQLVTANGTVVSDYRYEAFGSQLSAPPAATAAAPSVSVTPSAPSDSALLQLREFPAAAQQDSAEVTAPPTDLPADAPAGQQPDANVQQADAQTAALAAEQQRTASYGTYVTYLSDMEWKSETNAWGPVERDMSNGERAAGDGKMLNINGVEYAKGIGCNADSEIVIELNGLYGRFISDVGIDAESLYSGTVVFRVYGDGELLYESGVMKGNKPAEHIDVSVEGVQTLRLVADKYDVATNDHADWGGARLTMSTQCSYISDMPWQSEVNGLGAIERDRTNGEGKDNDGGDIYLDGVKYDKGVGCHADSEIVIALNRQYSTFISDVGIDDSRHADWGDVIFRVYGDNELLYESAELVGKGGGEHVEVSVEDVQTLRLVVDKIGVDNNDHAVWAGARLTKIPICYISDMPWQSEVNEWGPAERDMNNGEKAAGDGGDIYIGGVRYAKGIGCHADAEIVVALNGQYLTFISDVGIDDTRETNGNVIFRVYGDDELLYQSGALVGGGGSEHIEVSVEGVQTLRLVVDKNSSATHDHAAWGGARLQAKSVQKNAPDPTIPAPPNPFRYCGEYYDAETGNIYLRARYYNPSIG